MKRVWNFGAGPSMIPRSVLERAQRELLDFRGSGISIMESSHRAKLYDDVHNEAIALIRELYRLPDEYAVLFLQGGASLQFAMVPMNLGRGGRVEYADTGAWSAKAIKEAQIQGLEPKIVASSKESGYDHIPEQIPFSDDADYCYITSNNTIYGTQYTAFPKTKAPLVVDASSDIFSYPMEWERVDLLFAGAQKNAGPSGVTIVIVKKELLDRVQQNVPTMLRYKTHADANSLFNTPPTFAIYMLNLVMHWLKEQGGVEAISVRNEAKASLLYDAIDRSGGFYTAHAKEGSRSRMNVTFTIRGGDPALEAKLIERSLEEGMIGLKGHRSVGGLRASIYNAMPIEGVEALVDLLERFRREHS